MKKVAEEGDKVGHQIPWKYSLLLIIPVCYFYPKPLIFILSPLIKPFVDAYRRNNPINQIPKLIILSDRGEIPATFL